MFLLTLIAAFEHVFYIDGAEYVDFFGFNKSHLEVAPKKENIFLLFPNYSTLYFYDRDDNLIYQTYDNKFEINKYVKIKANWNNITLGFFDATNCSSVSCTEENGVYTLVSLNNGDKECYYNFRKFYYDKEITIHAIKYGNLDFLKEKYYLQSDYKKEDSSREDLVIFAFVSTGIGVVMYYTISCGDNYYYKDKKIVNKVGEIYWPGLPPNENDFLPDELRQNENQQNN